jgi:hypothetical protein
VESEAADEAVLNEIHKKIKKIPLFKKDTCTGLS